MNGTRATYRWARLGLGATGEAAAAGAVSGGAPVMEGERGQAGKLQHDKENLFRELAWAEKDRRWWRGGELSAAAMAGCSAGPHHVCS